ncbi:hypothetical protein ABEB36_007862 [Hypothenemus hampei]|uniref:Uncharacterized protein n=1 Tax=Hypothenemus hampei TaxID=57062 RepID=A0ABD1EVF3_HYPHA
MYLCKKLKPNSIPILQEGLTITASIPLNPTMECSNDGIGPSYAEQIEEQDSNGNNSMTKKQKIALIIKEPTDILSKDAHALFSSQLINAYGN